MSTRDDVLAVVKRHLVDTVEGIDSAQVDPAKSMKDLGANSLDIVEVVSCSMRELKVKIPRAELNKLTNINELVDLLHKTLQEKQAAAS
ncbi:MULTISPECIES: phosphopantetheine-binding protein [Nannocystis]|jgi:acyl carrier protein|uniref:Phosphopantetheine-binding protein n=2 Tax=Nannocystis TaxID=53 RepID=A0ABS7TL84_9BACT|nr:MULTISPECIES: phosphopantetheine-binding protein [Nannocystis]MBZ5708982.1 phosphopantetheine-binding protein [Nannocystis pusilla]MCY1062518.1 phosphopantetheine-binding protein [Nannocystis sp. SCPEA4]MDC0673930.1 phosphopantetheine-binding protein [Nannocystis radixulma]